jgi:hypothetical protein
MWSHGSHSWIQGPNEGGEETLSGIPRLPRAPLGGYAPDPKEKRKTKQKDFFLLSFSFFLFPFQFIRRNTVLKGNKNGSLPYGSTVA